MKNHQAPILDPQESRRPFPGLGSSLKGYLNPAALGRTEAVDLLTPAGERRAISLADIKSVYFVREFNEAFELERKTFLSRPKLDGLWVRLRFRDDDVMEGIVGNNLLDLLDAGVQITPPDLHGNTLRMFVPRSALTRNESSWVSWASPDAAPRARPRHWLQIRRGSNPTSSRNRRSSLRQPTLFDSTCNLVEPRLIELRRRSHTNHEENLS